MWTGLVLWWGVDYMGIHSTEVPVPFFKSDELLPDFGLFYIPFAAFVVVGTANAVNLTDGLDGLAMPKQATRLPYVRTHVRKGYRG